MIAILEAAGIDPSAAAKCLEPSLSSSLNQFNVLVETLEIVSDSIMLMTRILDGQENDPITIGYELTKQKAGVAAIHDEIAKLAPYAGVGEGWDPEETGRARAAAVAERNGFMAEIQALIKQRTPDED